MRPIIATPVIAVLFSFAITSCGDRPVDTGSDDPTAYGDPVYGEAAVDEPPERLSSPPLEYPRRLVEGSVEGNVVVAGTVGTDGKIEAGSVNVVSSTNEGFEQPAIRLLLGSRFRPARLKGAAVRARIQLPIQFTLVR